MNPIFLSVKDITFRYFEQARRNILEHVNLDIEAGKIVVILGNSGCGKSTLAAVCAGLYPENAGQLLSGSIQIDGQELISMSNAERTRKISMMFQNPDLQFCMDTLRKEMIFCLENICVPRGEMDDRIEEFAGKLQIEELLDRKLSTLSGGEKQKAVLCCLFLLESQGFLLDEPFANLDETSAKELITLLKKQNTLKHTTIIAIDHKLDYWLPIADEIIILRDGAQVVKRGITVETLPVYRDIFLREGLFYPDSIPQFKPANPSVVVLRMEHVAIKRKNSKEYLVTDGNATFERGRITALLGPSGCGKTSLFTAILKQAEYEGNIYIEGKNIKKIRQKKLFKQFGTVFQNPANQFIATRVSTEVEKGISIWYPNMTEDEKSAKVLELLESYQLKKYQKYSPYMLSQGQQRRLAVLAVLLGNQKILLLDEPTYGQDARSTKAILEHIRTLVREQELTVIFSTHDRQLAYQHADKIYCMEEKRLSEWKN